MRENLVQSLSIETERRTVCEAIQLPTLPSYASCPITAKTTVSLDYAADAVQPLNRSPHGKAETTILQPQLAPFRTH
jgi:hypothetical protein